MDINVDLWTLLFGAFPIGFIMVMVFWDIFKVNVAIGCIYLVAVCVGFERVNHYLSIQDSDTCIFIGIVGSVLLLALYHRKLIGVFND